MDLKTDSVIKVHDDVSLGDMNGLYEQYIDHHAEAALCVHTDGDQSGRMFAYCECAGCLFVIAMVSRGYAYMEAYRAVKEATDVRSSGT